MSSLVILGDPSSSSDTQSNKRKVGATTSVSHGGSSHASATQTQKHYLGLKPTTRRAVWVIRIIFLAFLMAVAAVLGYVGHFIVSSSEDDIGEQQYNAVADRALDLAKELFIRRHVVDKSMAQIAASAFPDADQWPNVAIPAFETFARDLISTSDNLDLGFYPMVRPEQEFPGEQSSFEEFAYDYFYNKRSPPFPNNTAVKSFGRGIWSRHGHHDTSGNTEEYAGPNWEYLTRWTSPNRILFPELQNSYEGDLGTTFLMFNIHYDLARGQAIDAVIECSKIRKAEQNSHADCSVVTKVTYHDRSSYLVQPVYPANDMFELTGVVVSKLSWDVTVARMFGDSGATGLTLALDAEGVRYSYHVDSGVTTFTGPGVLHGDYDEWGRSITLGSTSYSSEDYVLTINPTDEFFDIYSTNNPRIVTIGAVFVVILTSLLFILYDFMVRQEFHNKQAVLEAKRKFMRFVSHEVRTPLNAVCMGLELLHEEFDSTRKDADDNKDETLTTSAASTESPGHRISRKSLDDWFRLLNDIRATAANSVDVLNDLLNYDKIEVGSLSLEYTIFSIWFLVVETTNEFRLSAKKKRLKFELDMSTLMDDTFLESSNSFQDTNLPQHLHLSKLVGDRTRITQVLRNLISNAIKFTPEGGSVTVEVSWVAEVQGRRRRNDTFTLALGDTVHLDRAGWVQIKVTDTGAGMTDDQLARLGREGIQFNVNELQAGQGSGLGLFISKGIVLQHGGRLGVASEGAGHGSVFTCLLPLHSIPEEQNESSEEALACTYSESESQNCLEEGKFRPLNVLVVDDVASNRKLLKRLVARRGHVVDDAKDGREAVESVKEYMRRGRRYDVILMDYEMPILQGPEAVKEIRELGVDSFVVGITGNVLIEDVRHFMSCGANAVLPKPVDMSKLIELWTEHGVTGSSRKIEECSSSEISHVLLKT